MRGASNPTLGSVARELREKQYEGWELNFLWYRSVTGAVNQRRLSDAARLLVNTAYTSLTGMHLPCNEYYLADALSEAIEAAEALGL